MLAFGGEISESVSFRIFESSSRLWWNAGDLSQVSSVIEAAPAPKRPDWMRVGNCLGVGWKCNNWLVMMTQRMRKWLEFMIDPEVNGLLMLEK